MTEILKQDQYSPLTMEKQVAIIYAATNGYLDPYPVTEARRYEKELYTFLETRHPDLLKQMFLKHAQEKAHAEWTSEESEFKAKELHQKAEIGKIDILQTRSDAVLTQVSGQLIRSGIFQERAFSEAVPFVLKLKMLRNPNMVENGRFPTAIQDFKYEPTH